MGNAQTPLNTTEAESSTNSNDSPRPQLRKSRSLRDYTRVLSANNASTSSSSTTTTTSKPRKLGQMPRPRSMAPTDAEIIDIRALRCELPSKDLPPEDGIPISNKTNLGENLLIKQLEYMQSCVRKDKGLLGK